MIRLLFTILPWIFIVSLIFFFIRLFKGRATEAVEYIIGGGILLGIIGLLLGSVGAILIAPKNNLLPIIGVFITGPAGFIVGLFAGWRYWYKKIHLREKNAGVLPE